MKNKIIKGFLALALIFTLIGTQTLKDNKIGAYAPTEPLIEFNTPNLLTDFEIVSYQDVVGDPYINFLAKNIDLAQQKFVGFNISLIYTYLLDLNGLQKYIDSINIIPIYQGYPVINNALTLQIDNNSSQQLINIYELNPDYFEVQVSDVVEFIFMFNTPNIMGEITKDMVHGIGLYNYTAELLYEKPIDKNALNSIYNFISKPIDDLLDYIGITNDINISPGFGEVIWFSLPLRLIINLIIVFFICLWFIKFILKLIKKFFSLIFGGFTL